MARQRLKREKQECARALMLEYRTRVLFNLLRNLKEIRQMRKERHRSIVDTLASSKMAKVWLHLRLRADTKAL